MPLILALQEEAGGTRWISVSLRPAGNGIGIVSSQHRHDKTCLKKYQNEQASVNLGKALWSS